MEYSEIIRTAGRLFREAWGEFRTGDERRSGDKLLELKRFLVAECDDTQDEPTTEAAADQAATEAERAAKEASQAEPSESSDS